jgi:hypothetical protein
MAQTLRTPLEQALGTRLDLDFEDLHAGDLEHHDVADARREGDLLDAAVEAGEFLYREAVRLGVKGL